MQCLELLAMNLIIYLANLNSSVDSRPFSLRNRETPKISIQYLSLVLSKYNCLSNLPEEF